MKKVYLNGRAMHSREEAHEQIARALEFPEWYGKNLDGLWVLLCDAQAEIDFGGTDAMLAALGEYGLRLLKTFYDAAEENPDLDFRVKPDWE